MPASASARSSSLAGRARRTARPWRSSWSPGCSPTNTIRAVSGPSPNTVCVAGSHSSQARHPAAAVAQPVEPDALGRLGRAVHRSCADDTAAMRSRARRGPPIRFRPVNRDGRESGCSSSTGSTRASATTTCSTGSASPSRRARCSASAAPTAPARRRRCGSRWACCGPTPASVRWQGRPLDQESRRRIGYMPEERGLYPKMKVGEQVTYFARLHGLDAAAAARGRRGVDRPARVWASAAATRWRSCRWATSSASSWPPRWSAGPRC